MSGLITVSSLPRISRERLSGLVLAQTGRSRGGSDKSAQSTVEDPQAQAEQRSLAIIDVRDDDHVGGHIVHSQHVPSTTLSYRLPELVRTLADKDVVVFHCSLSQQRGPGAGLGYLREKERLMPSSTATSAGGRASGGEEDRKGQQEVYVLDGGFVEWQEKYGPDPRLTEGWVRDVWES